MTKDPGAPLTERSLVASYYITEGMYTYTGKELEARLPMSWSQCRRYGLLSDTFNKQDAACPGEEYFVVFVASPGRNVRGH